MEERGLALLTGKILWSKVRQKTHRVARHNGHSGDVNGLHRSFGWGDPAVGVGIFQVQNLSLAKNIGPKMLRACP